MSEKPYNPRPWSYSREKCFLECERRYWLGYVQGVEFAPSAAMRRGSEKHAMFEALVQGKEVEGMDADDMAAWNRVEPLVRDEQVETEKELAVDAFRMPVDYDSPDAFLRGKLDVISGGLIIDWKMGQSMMYDQRQADIYAILLSAKGDVCWPLTVSFVFPYIKPECSGTDFVSFGPYCYDPKGMRDIWDLMQSELMALETEIGKKNPADKEDWAPNPAGCSGCGVWASCDFCNGDHITKILEAV